MNTSDPDEKSILTGLKTHLINKRCLKEWPLFTTDKQVVWVLNSVKPHTSSSALAKNGDCPYNGAMISQRLYYAQFKRLAPKQAIPYKDPFRKLHLKNIEAHKREKRLEERFERHDLLEKQTQLVRQERDAIEYAQRRTKLLNVI